MQLSTKFCLGEYESDIDGEVWIKVFEYIVKNADNLTLDKVKIHTLLTVNGGHLRNKIRDDDLIIAVLNISLPGYSGEGLTLYRGECRFLYDEGKIGFCWSPDIEVASKFARGLNSIESGGILLEAYAPSVAILAAPNVHSSNQMKEFEYTCNPRLLKTIKALEIYERPDQYA